MKEILLFKSYADDNEEKAVKKVLDRGTFWANGPEIKEFESKMASFLGKRHAVALNSGTSALYLILLSYGIDSGEVIVPSFTFPATANSVELTGARPVFADIETKTFCLDVNDVEKKITPQTRAIMPIHFAGAVANDIEALRELAKEHELYLIEDNAQSFGATLEGKLSGTFGEASITSFCFNKVLTTGEGGMVFTDDEKIAEKIRLYRSHGRSKNKDYVLAGTNMRMPTMAAAIGLAQLRKFDSMIQRRRQLASIYDKGLSQNPKMAPILYDKENKTVYCQYNVLFNNEKDRDSVVEKLKERGIPTRVSYPPVHLYTFYRQKYGQQGDLPITEETSKRILSIPFHLDLSPEQQTYIISNINECLNN